MKKISQIYRQTAAKFINESLKGSNSFFLVKYSGLSAADMNNLRQSLKQIHARMFISRNTVAKRIFMDLKQQDVVNLIDGPTGIVFASSDPAVTSKALYNFAKENNNFKIEGAVLDDKFLDRKVIEELARLPSRDVLVAKTVMTIKSPLSKFVFVLNENLRKLVCILDQIKNRKDAEP